MTDFDNDFLTIIELDEELLADERDNYLNRMTDEEFARAMADER